MTPTASAGPFWMKALILSLLLHLLVAQLFLFAWPLKTIEPRPQLVFFGAVLDNGEVTGGTAHQQDQRLILQPHRVVYHPAHAVAPYEDREVGKPAYPEAAGKSPIAPVKFNYLPPPEKTVAPHPAETTDELPQTPKYQPLRLHPKTND